MIRFHHGRLAGFLDIFGESELKGFSVGGMTGIASFFFKSFRMFAMVKNYLGTFKFAEDFRMCNSNLVFRFRKSRFFKMERGLYRI
jgi:hypothetical protein